MLRLCDSRWSLDRYTMAAILPASATSAAMNLSRLAPASAGSTPAMESMEAPLTMLEKSVTSARITSATMLRLGRSSFIR